MLSVTRRFSDSVGIKEWEMFMPRNISGYLQIPGTASVVQGCSYSRVLLLQFGSSDSIGRVHYTDLYTLISLD